MAGMEKRMLNPGGFVVSGGHSFCRVRSRAPRNDTGGLQKFDPDVDKILAQMTLDEKIGQMIQPDQGALKSPDDIEKYCLGSLLSGGGSGPRTNPSNNLQGWTELVEGYQKHALATRLAIPLIYGVDAVHGHYNIPNATVFPHHIAMGCTGDADLVTKMERVTAEEVPCATGINWVFAPASPFRRTIRWGAAPTKSFSDDPALVKLPQTPAAVRGFQGDSLDDPLSEVACVKHFAGDGGTAFGTGDKKEHALLDRGDTQVDEATLRRIHLPGYIAAIAAGARHHHALLQQLWNGVKCSRQPNTSSPTSSRANSASKASSSPVTTPSTSSPPTTNPTSPPASTPVSTWS